MGKRSVATVSEPASNTFNSFLNRKLERPFTTNYGPPTERNLTDKCEDKVKKQKERKKKEPLFRDEDLTPLLNRSFIEECTAKRPKPVEPALKSADPLDDSFDMEGYLSWVSKGAAQDLFDYPVLASPSSNSPEVTSERARVIVEKERVKGVNKPSYVSPYNGNHTSQTAKPAAS